MRQADLNRAVARATGETVSEIAHRGFVPLMAVPYEREGATVDWDEQDARRNICWYPQRKRGPVTV